MKNIKIEVKWAIIFVMMTLSWMLMERLTGLDSEHIDKHEIFTNFIAIPAIAVYVFALLDKRKRFYNGQMTYLQGFISGLIITGGVAVVSPLTQYITSTIINPDYFTSIINHTVEKGKMTREAAEDFYNLKSFIVQGLVGAPGMGLLTTAIVAFFAKNSSKSIFKIRQTPAKK